MHRDQGRRASGINSEVRSLNSEGVRHASPCHAARDAGGKVSAEGCQIAGAEEPLQKLVAANADKDAGSVLLEGLWPLTSILQRLPTNLQHEPLLRVHRDSFARRNAEELGIEFVHSIEQPRPSRRHFAWRIGIGIVEILHRPA